MADRVWPNKSSTSVEPGSLIRDVYNSERLALDALLGRDICILIFPEGRLTSFGRGQG